jgi:hypothetical protein
MALPYFAAKNTERLVITIPKISTKIHYENAEVGTPQKGLFNYPTGIVNFQCYRIR